MAKGQTKQHGIIASLHFGPDTRGGTETGDELHRCVQFSGFGPIQFQIELA